MTYLAHLWIELIVSPSPCTMSEHALREKAFLSDDDTKLSLPERVRRYWQEVITFTLFAVGLTLIFISQFSTASQCTPSPLLPSTTLAAQVDTCHSSWRCFEDGRTRCQDLAMGRSRPPRRWCAVGIGPGLQALHVSTQRQHRLVCLHCLISASSAIKHL